MLATQLHGWRYSLWWAGTGRDGNFYGTTYGGGANGDGTVFTISSAGNFASLHSFAGASDGSYPDAALVQATDSNLYGTTFEGGAHGLGTVFKITLAGALTTLHNFSGYPVEGELPTASLVQVGESLYAQPKVAAPT